MGEPLQRKTYAEYLAIERAAETKYEFVDGQVVAMAGGTPEHARLAANVSAALVAALRGRPCSAFSANLRIHVPATGRSSYPDVTVVCDERRTADVDDDAIVYRRESDVWALRDYGPGQQVALPSLDVTLSVDEIYTDPLT